MDLPWMGNKMLTPQYGQVGGDTEGGAKGGDRGREKDKMEGFDGDTLFYRASWYLSCDSLL